jgi:hypothetical protein
MKYSSVTMELDTRRLYMGGERRMEEEAFP